MVKKSVTETTALTPAEQRAARAERIKVSEAQPYGWLAESESANEHGYHLFCHPKTKQLVCTCADFIFRGKDEPAYECKHVSAVLKFIGRRYLTTEYSPIRQNHKVG
jgi:hypothetical protein